MSSQINTTEVSPNRAINTPDESYADESNQRSVTPMPLITTAIPKNPGSNNQSNYSASSTSTTSNRSNQTSTAVNSSIIPRSIPSNRVTPAPIITSTINSSVIPQSSSPSPKSSKSQSNTPTAATSTHHKHTIDETGGGIIASMPPPQTATITRRPAAPKKSTVTRPTKTAMLPPPNSPASRAQTAQSRLTYRKFISWLWNPCGFLHRSKISGAGSHFTTRKGLTNNGTGGTNRMSGKPPSNYQGPQPPLLKPSTEPHKKCLVLDLDETLVHSAFRPLDNADFVIPVNIDEESFNVYVLKRPWVDTFLKKAAELYEIVVFTASLSKYADPVIDKLDRHKVVKHRLFRESCVNIKGNFVKDLSMLGRDLKKVVILDNSAASYLLHPKNAIPITTWYSDPQDRELADVMQLLVGLSKVDDVTLILNGNVKK